MALAWRVLRWFLVAVLVLALTAGLLGVWAVRRPFPDVDGTATLPALSGDVTVHRDAWGVAHVYGETVEDVVRGQGWVHAQDRFWEMDVRRHITAGRLSELFGEDQVETDAFIRTLGWRRVAEQELELLDERSLALLEAYSEGVNAYIGDRSPGQLSLEYAVLGLSGGVDAIEPWEPADSLAWLKAMAWDLRSNSDIEIERARLVAAGLDEDEVDDVHPSYPFDRFGPIVETDGTGFTAAGVAEAVGAGTAGTGIGSNSWVVSGAHTASGAAMLANDPHLAPSQPGIWHQVGLHCRAPSDDCPLDVSGFSFSGLPGVVIGRNDRVAWGVTNLAADVADHYVERVDGDRYEVDGAWVDMDVRTETIEVAGGDPVEVRVRSTRHGPLVSDASEELRAVAGTAQLLPGMPADAAGADVDRAVSLRWTALEPGRTFDALYGLNTARDFEDFRAAAALFEVPAQNLVYADVDGHIGYQAPGRHPIRAAGHDGRYPAAGWTTDTDWQGFIPFDDLPFVLDPDRGFIVTANEAVVGPGYAYDLPGEWAPGFRAARIEELLEDALADDRMDLDELAAIQLDDEIGLAEILVGPLLDVEVRREVRPSQELLQDWDGQMHAESPAAAFFGATMRQVLLRTFAGELPEDLPPDDRGRWWLLLDELLASPSDNRWDDSRTTELEDSEDILRLSMSSAHEELTERFGPDRATWQWGAMHTLTLEHQTLGQSGIGPIEALFNRGPFPTGGGGSVVNATGWEPAEGYEVNWVPSMRMVVDLGAPDDARWINLTGQSGHAFHRHYDDMAPLWARGDLVPWHGTAGAVEDTAVSTQTLTP